MGKKLDLKLTLLCAKKLAKTPNVPNLIQKNHKQNDMASFCFVLF